MVKKRRNKMVVAFNETTILPQIIASFQTQKQGRHVYVEMRVISEQVCFTLKPIRVTHATFDSNALSFP